MHNMRKNIKVLEYLGIIGNGGIESFVFNTTLAIEHPNLEILYYCYNHCSKDNIYYTAAMKKGKKIIFGRTQIKKFKLIKFFAKILDLWSCCKENDIDIIHFHISFPFEILLAIPLKLSGYKIILHQHNANVTNLSLIIRVANMIGRFLISWCSPMLLACSKDAAKWAFPAKAYKNNNYSIVSNSINSFNFVYNEYIRDAKRNELGLFSKFVIGHIGRFVYQKNHTFLIDIFREVRKKEPNAILLLIGSGKLETEIRKKVNEFGLADYVFFGGNIDKIYEMYQVMDCFVFPSHYEGLGIVAIEAQAAGLKILCSDAVPQEAMITELMEYMPLTESSEKWAEKILTYNDGYLRKNMQQKIIEAGYDIKDSARKLEETYLTVRC